jgi:pyruvate dehydrogenase E2 component (dihydrolipoamide acetyltransferase)
MSVEVVMPQMGESIAEGTITKWLKKAGDRVERDEPLFEISTDKVDAEIPAPSAGTLKEIRAQEGETVAVNAIVAVIDPAGNGAATPTASSATKPTAEPSPVAAPTTTSQPQADGAAISTPVQTSTPPKTTVPTAAPTMATMTTTPTVEDLRRTKSSPLVRKIANEHGVDISQIEGSGASGRVTKDDILNFIESGPTGTATQKAPITIPTPQAPPASYVQTLPPVQPAEGDRVEPMSAIRKKIAEHMMLSRRTSAHVTTVYEIDMTRVAKLREQHKTSFLERHGVKLTFMPFVFQAVTNAIQKYPIFNAQVGADQIIYKRDINLGMAVALDWGLIVPVIKHADGLSIAGLARTSYDLAERARTKQLKPDEVSGGTFTITNPGVFGGLFGTPIINQPQVAILGIGVIEKRAKVITTSDGEDTIAIRSMAYFALSFDHRIIDGADAERFLSHIKQILEAGQFAL